VASVESGRVSRIVKYQPSGLVVSLRLLLTMAILPGEQGSAPLVSTEPLLEFEGVARADNNDAG
jgi:hypothetical protein